MRDTTPAPAHAIDSLQTRLGRSHLLRLVTALILAIGTWGWVMQATDPIRGITHTEVEIVMPPLPDGLISVTTLPRGEIEVEGPRSEVERTNRSTLSLRVDTSSITGPGEYRLPVVVNAPNTATRISVDPQHVQVLVDSETSKVMPLEVERVDSDGGNRLVSGIRPEVSQVTVSGPSMAVDRVAAVVLPVEITTQLTTFTEGIEPVAVDASGQTVTEVTVLPNEISTRVEMQSRGKVVSVIANVTGNPADGYTTQQKNALPASITVDGPPDVLSTLLFVETEPVDISGASQSVSARVGLADLPEGVTVLEPASGMVEVRVAIQDSSATSQTITNLPVNAVNVAPGQSLSFEPNSVDVTVQGPVSTIQEMTGGDITVVVDVRGLPPGTHELTPFVALMNPQVRSEGTNPETITVTIEETPQSTPVDPTAPRQGTPEALSWQQEQRSTRPRHRTGK